MKQPILIATLFASTAFAVVAWPKSAPVRPTPVDPVPPPPAQITQAPRIDVVFALDTTGSMSGLIAAAKENIWSIASTMAAAQPTPEIRMGLVAFRDKGDEYVTRITDLSADLDSMYATLMDFQAAGGGDGPESVNQALYDAVHGMSWSQGEGVYRVVFLVGDAPPHMDYQEMQYPEIVARARERGIVVNTIQAGGNPSTQRVWREIASLNQAEFLQVAQSGDAVAVATPFDERMAALSRELDETRLFYGDAGERAAQELKEKAAAKVHALGSAASRAKRAAFNASESGRRNFLGDKELVDDVVSGKVDLNALAPDQMPAALKPMAPAERQNVIAATAEKRAQLKKEMEGLMRQRRDFIKDRLEETDADEDSLDRKIFDTVKSQAAAAGLDYAAEEPSY